MARTATVLRDSAIGTGSVVEDGALVRACTFQLWPSPELSHPKPAAFSFMPCKVWIRLLGWQIEASVLGRNCRVGRGAHVRGSYLLDGAVVGARAHVLGALLANGVHVGDNAVVPPGAMLSFNVRPCDHLLDYALWSCGPLLRGNFVLADQARGVPKTAA